MLYFETVTTEALSLLRLIQQNDLAKDLRLVGGTSLALQNGHRKSIDLDFFGKYDATYEELSAMLRDFGKTEVLKNSASIKVFVCKGVKVDFVNYPYAWIDDPIQTNDLILASEKDIGAMKLSAIAGRGSRKDFYDLYILLSKYSLKELLSFYEAKYDDGNIYLVLKSMVYFEDAEEEENPVMLNELTWEEVKSRIIQEHAQFFEDN